VGLSAAAPVLRDVSSPKGQNQIPLPRFSQKIAFLATGKGRKTSLDPPPCFVAATRFVQCGFGFQISEFANYSSLGFRFDDLSLLSYSIALLLFFFNLAQFVWALNLIGILL
jgi:hypothetical protein